MPSFCQNGSEPGKHENGKRADQQADRRAERSDLKKKVMINELKNLTNDIVGKNGWEMTRQIYERTKITSTEREMKDFYNKYVKSLRLKINEDGVFEIVVNEY